MRPFLLFLVAALLSLPVAAQKVVSKQKATGQKVKIKKSARKAAPAAPVAKAKTEAGPVLTFARTQCFGLCPAYRMEVYADGRVAYEGFRAVPLMGKKELKLPVSVLTEMLNMAKEVHFEQFDGQYSQHTSDLPSTIVSIRQPSGKAKTVVVEEGAPEVVNQYMAYLTNKFDGLAQIQGSDR